MERTNKFLSIIDMIDKDGNMLICGNEFCEKRMKIDLFGLYN